MTTQETRQKILDLYINEGYKQRQIARTLRLSPSTVHHWISQNGKARKRTGRGRKTSPEEDNQIYTMSVENPFLPATDINRQLSLNISSQTIRNRLIERGLHNYKTAQKFSLTEAQKANRLEFAHTYGHWTADQWETVLFADEKVYQSFGQGHSRVWRPKLSRWLPENQVKRYDASVIATVKQSGRFSISLWGCIGKKNHLHCITISRLNKDHFLDYILKKYITPGDILVHDNSPIHTANIIKKWLQESNVTVLKWPPYSPDLNPIENMWGRIEQLTRNRQPESKEHLWTLVKTTFDTLVQQENYIQNLVRSMPKRLQEVLRVEGNVTKY